MMMYCMYVHVRHASGMLNCHAKEFCRCCISSLGNIGPCTTSKSLVVDIMIL